MIRLHFLGDGPRDEAVLPGIVSKLLGVEVRSTFEPWKSIRVGGFDRKLALSLRRLKDAPTADGLVAVVDRDKSDPGTRLKLLVNVRDRFRAHEPLGVPAAVGEAAPHGEAWLLDDRVAVQRVLGLDQSVRIPSMKNCNNPKEALESLIAGCTRRHEGIRSLFTEIAELIDRVRCSHADTTGFGDFVAEVHAELGSHIAKDSGDAGTNASSSD